MSLSQQPADFDESTQKKIDAWKAEQVSADGEILKLQEKLYQPLYKKRGEIVSSVDNFWPQAIANCEQLMPYFDDVDQPLIAKLKDVEVTKDANDPRACTITFTFHDNDYLAENKLVKEFTLKKDASPLGHEDFEWTDDLVPQKTEIKWKSDDVNLCKKKPTTDPKKDDDEFEPGSFFSSFFESTSPEIANGIGSVIALNFYPVAIEWYTGEAIGAFDSLSDYDVDDEDDEEGDEDDSDDDGAAEIDLDEKDKKPAKRAKTSK